MLFSVLLWSLCIIWKAYGRNIPVDLSVKEPTVNDKVNDSNNRRPIQKNELSDTDVHNDIESKVPIDNVFPSPESKDLGSTLPPTSLSVSSSSSSVATTGLSSTPRLPSASSLSSSSSLASQPSESTTLEPPPLSSSSSSSSSLSSSSSRPRPSTTIVPTAKDSRLFVFRKRKAIAQDTSPASTKSTTVTTSPTTTVKTVVKNKMSAKCLLLQKIKPKIKLPRECSRIKQSIDMWS